MTQDPTLEPSALPAPPRPKWPPEAQLMVRILAAALGALLAGYMFLGRGFAHIGIGPVYVGDVVLVLGLATAAVVVIRTRALPPITWTIALLLGFVALGAVRTLPYLGLYRLDALRDGVLWGYAAFALIVYLLVDRAFLLRAFRLYGWVVPIFALWLPISWNLFARASAGIDPSNPGSFTPLVFFKGGDMAVHTVGAIAFLVIGASSARSPRVFLWRVLICLPLLWTAFVAGTSNRGALLTTAIGIVAVAFIARRWRPWRPLLTAIAAFATALIIQGVIAQLTMSAPPSSAEPTVIATDAETSLPSSRPEASSSLPPSHGQAGSTSTEEPREGTPLAVVNPGFELGPVNSGTIAGWTIRAAGPHNIVEGAAFRGARYASMKNVARAYEDTITSSRFQFKGGPDIAVSVWVRAIKARPILEIYVNWYDRSGTLISSVFLNSLATDGRGNWQECTGTLTAPANTTQAEILFYEAAGKATIGLDDVTVWSGDFVPEPVPAKGRPATFQQMIENLFSIFGSSSDATLEGSKQFRLAWWGKIVNYTVFGEYFWVGKGFGVNLADNDGFQSTTDHSLRSPHNSEMTVLARMGVPGLLLWVLVQGAFGIGLVRAIIAHERGGDWQVAAVGGWIFAYWVAMLVDTSFDPYLEGPQGGIWFWTIFGLGLVVISLIRKRRVAP